MVCLLDISHKQQAWLDNKITKFIKFEGLVILTNKNAKYWCSKFTYLEKLHSQLASHAYSDTVLYSWNALRAVLFEVKQIFWVFNLSFNFQGYALGWQQISIIMLTAILLYVLIMIQLATPAQYTWAFF